MKQVRKRTLVPALVLVMAMAVGACDVVDDDPGGTLPPGVTTTTILDS